MKVLLTLSILVHSCLLLAQNTTREEYNYMTKGYKIALESGLDLKAGYSTPNKTESKIGTYQFTFVPLIRTPDNSLAGIIVRAYSSSWGNTYYFGIPLQGDPAYSELNQLYYNAVSSLDESMTTALLSAWTGYSASFINMLLKEVDAKQ